MGSERYDLGSEALAYVRSELAQGRALARAALQQLRLKEGRLSVYLPPGIPSNALYDFQSGGLGGQVNDVVVDRVSRHVSVGPDRIALFEHPAVRRTDLSMRNLAFPSKDIPFITVNEDVLMIAHGDITTDVVRQIVREAHWYPSVGVLSSVAVDEIPAQAAAMSSEAFGRTVDRISQLFIGAYDGEEWLIWERM